MKTLSVMAIALAMLASSVSGAEPKSPVLLGLDAEMGLAYSTSGQAIEKGILTAIDEINAAGGVLGGRPLQLVAKDNRSMPARGIDNIKSFAEMPGLVAVFGGRFSPVVIEELPILRDTKTLFLAPWSSADPIIDNGMVPNYSFRLSLRDSLAMPFMFDHTRKIGARKVGLLLVNTAWGRSGLAAAERYIASGGAPPIAATTWFNWKDKSVIDKYEHLLNAGADAIIMIANDDQASVLIKEMAALPKERRIPIISHWGVTGGQLVEVAGDAMQAVDFTVIQTFSFFKADKTKVDSVLKTTNKLFGISKVEDIVSPVGFAHAYDLTHIIARAINMAGTTDRASVRDTLERVTNYHGLVRKFDQPFTADRHEALGAADLLMARYRTDGVLVPVP
ncbi:Branched-chain amino acid ABC transporter amino acid-binding protein [Paramagnetospirillum magnetotacticum MS-1]|uniref:Branched-chain amino acid ABC transporter amino acid-binding protein n=1 Tax=Paramagnetospirillum magnetotacticum MS-1 TaxID=272627 RepID=A0A0C2YWX9_PARME|nr:ABC transporter substrate-binding protein [Paramagnetospirillum magnetotacticum]KIL99613.1 Branched-chain amino acid ABC transporter amino acid-binding protein [Paramagnetospirillum magnetotacticum MS-1]